MSCPPPPGDSDAFQKVFPDGTLLSIFSFPLYSVIVCMEFLSAVARKQLCPSLFGKKIVFFDGETRKNTFLWICAGQAEG